MSTYTMTTATVEVEAFEVVVGDRVVVDGTPREVTRLDRYQDDFDYCYAVRLGFGLRGAEGSVTLDSEDYVLVENPFLD